MTKYLLAAICILTSYLAPIANAEPITDEDVGEAIEDLKKYFYRKYDSKAGN